MKYTRVEWWLPKLLCLIAACCFWVYVMNEQNPIVENTYTVPVEKRNLDRSLVAMNVPSSVRVKVRMSRSDMIYIRTDSIKAYVNMEGLTAGEYPNTQIYVSVPGNEQVVSVSPQYFNLKLDNYAVKSLPVTVEFIGTPDLNFSAEKKQVNPDMITIAGSSTSVEQADRAVVSVNVSGKDKSFKEFDSVNVLDADGDTVTGIDIMPSQVKVEVNMKEQMKMGNLPIRAETKGEPAPGYKVGKVTVNPLVGTLNGPVSYFDTHKEIVLDAIDVTDATETISQTVPIPRPEDGTVIPERASVEVEIVKS